MISGDLKNKADWLWSTFRSNGISNARTIIEPVSYMLFFKRLDDEEWIKEKRGNLLGRLAKGLRLGPDQTRIRWLVVETIRASRLPTTMRAGPR